MQRSPWRTPLLIDVPRDVTALDRRGLQSHSHMVAAGTPTIDGREITARPRRAAESANYLAPRRE
jgi:hypothetical protein